MSILWIIPFIGVLWIIYLIIRRKRDRELYKWRSEMTQAVNELREEIIKEKEGK